jgi:3',5'-cyclic AMP phosphodiesterase CpdA
MTPMRIAQITDLHIEADGRPTQGTIDSAGNLRRTLAVIAQMDPRPDLILATGDLTETGSAAETAEAAEILAAAPVPVYVLTGNHDDRDAIRAAFPGHDYLPAIGFLHYVIEKPLLRVIALDSKRAGSCGGEICAERLDWLRARLDEAPDRPTMIALHHPPFATRSPVFDDPGFAGLDAFRAEIAARPNLVALVCGHVHRQLSARIGTVPVGVAPSTAYTYSLYWRRAQGLHPTEEPPGFQLHDWDPEEGLVTHTVLLTDRG